MAVEAEVKPIAEEPKVDRKSAIEAAVKEADKLVEAEDRKEDKVEDNKKEEPKKEEPKDDKDEELSKQGLALVKALNDPQKAGIVIKFLAEQAGYTKAPETKTEVKEAKEEILDILKDELGDEFTFFSTKLGPALDKILDKKLEDIRKEVRQESEARQAEKMKSEADKISTKLGESYFGKGETIPDNVLDEMSKLMEKNPPTKDITLQDYLETSFYAAVGKLGITKDSITKQPRINKNRNDAPSRLASERGPAPDAIKQDTSKPMSRSEAIRQAAESLSKG